MASRILAIRSVRRMATSSRFHGATGTASSLLESAFTSRGTGSSFPLMIVHTVDRRCWFSESARNGAATHEEPNMDEDTVGTEPAAAPRAGAPVDGGDEEVEPAIDAAEPSREELLEAEVKKLKHQLLTSLADQENTRRIAQNDVSTAKKFAIKSFAKSLLDVSDNLERALQAVPDGMEKNKEEHPVLANLYEGIELTGQGLVKAFEANGLVKYGQVGEAFDPNKHNALFEYPDPNQTPGVVGQVIKPGYMLSDRVLRPAEVGVVKKV